MTFQDITTEEIETGQPVANSTQTKIKENFESLDDRVSALETGGNTIYPPIILAVNGYYSGVIAAQIIKTTLNFNLTITGIRLLIDVAGSSGTTEIDIKYKRGGAGYVSVLSTKPAVGFAAGNDSISTNAVLDLSKVGLQAGDILALDITSTQAGAKNLYVRIDYNKT